MEKIPAVRHIRVSGITHVISPTISVTQPYVISEYAPIADVPKPIAPKKSSTTDNFQEMKGGGYAPRTMWGIIWNKKKSYFENIEIFEFEDGVGIVCGYYVTGRGQLIFAERFSEPYEIKYSGDKIEIKFRIRLK